jgi:hypothetical protein
MYFIDNNNSKEERNNRAQKVAEITHQIASKFESMGIKRKSTLMVSADLADIFQYAEDVRKLIPLFLDTSSSDKDALQTIFVSLKVILGEIKDHTSHARPQLDYVAEYCEKDSGN